MRTIMTRAFFTPRSYAAKILPKGIEAEIYLMDGNIAMAFGGKRAKPDFHIRFQTPERRAKHIADYVERMTERQEYKAKEAANKKAFAHTLKVGDVLYSSWGYDQTNIDYYQVTAVVGKKTVKIRQIHSMIDHHDGCQSNMVVPAIDSFYEKGNEWDRRGDEMTKRVRDGNYVTVGHTSAHPWDGTPNRETDAYSGH